MKISKLFHWLYFTVMMLPVFLIPIFAIYTRNENYSSNIQLQVPENKVVNFNQFVKNGDFVNGDNWNISGGTVSFEDNIATISKTTTNNSSTYLTQSGIDIVIDHVYYCKVFVRTNDNTRIRFFVVNGLSGIDYQANDGTYQWYSFVETALSNNTGTFRVQSRSESATTIIYVRYCQFFDLTTMFGAGNEPTKEQFDTWYSYNYYSYNTGELQLLDNYSTITYSDTDVGSQMVYTLYNTVDKYFNFDSVFNFGDLYTWLNTNFFNGNAPLGFFIFWHYLIYWLLVSILWLLFDVLIYVPQLVHRWLDKASLS